MKLLMRALLCLALASAYAVSALPSFQLRDTDGGIHTPAEWNAQKAIVLYFITNDCPLANSYVPEMDRIHDIYAPRGVNFYAVAADPAVPAAVLAEYAKAYRYEFPLLLDPRQVLVELAGATVTPQVVVLSPAGTVLYKGRIDNRVEDFGREHPEATVHDLRDALDAVLSARPVPHPATRSIGCAITKVK